MNPVPLKNAKAQWSFGCFLHKGVQGWTHKQLGSLGGRDLNRPNFYDSYKLTLDFKLKPATPYSCIVCNFWSFHFRNNVSIFQEHSKNTKIQVYILPIS